jgi:ribosome-binding factor A
VERVAELLRAELASLLIRRVKDPCVEGLTITAVVVSPDLSVAKVYFAAPDDEAAARGEEGLDRAASFLRREVAATLRLRKIPDLRFLRDEVLERGMRIDAILKDIGGGGS